MQPQNNLIQEISAIILASLLAIIGGVLLYVGKIDFTAAMGIWALAAGLFGFNLAFKAPSPSQQAQIGTQQNQLNAQQASLQQLISYALNMLPGLLQSLQAPPVPAQVVQTAPPIQPVVTSAVASDAVAQSPAVQQQFKTPTSVPAVTEHPPIDPSMMVNTFPNIPAFGQPTQK